MPSGQPVWRPALLISDPCEKRGANSRCACGAVRGCAWFASVSTQACTALWGNGKRRGGRNGLIFHSAGGASVWIYSFMRWKRAANLHNIFIADPLILNTL
jgi:hypothetical protein